MEFYGEADQWGVQDYHEKYCDCEAGDRLRERDGRPPGPSKAEAAIRAMKKEMAMTAEKLSKKY
jgi:hypothetical protein